MDKLNNSEFPHLSSDCELASLDGINLTNQIYSKSGEQNTRTGAYKSDITFVFYFHLTGSSVEIMMLFMLVGGPQCSNYST